MLNEAAQKLNIRTDGLSKEEIRTKVLAKQFPTISLQGRSDAYLDALVERVGASMAYQANLERITANVWWKTTKSDQAAAPSGYRQEATRKPRTQDEIEAAQRLDALEKEHAKKMAAYQEFKRRRRIDAGLEHADPKRQAEAEAVRAQFAAAAERDFDLIHQANKETLEAHRKQRVLNRNMDPSWKKPLKSHS